jgi:hypothetical protein
MPDYQKAKIYKLWSPSKNLVYYGSTTQSISQRLTTHIKDFKNKINNFSSFIVLECEDYKIELVEKYPCNNRQQLVKREGEYIKTNECVNKNIAGRTRKEYRKECDLKIKEYAKNYREKHNLYIKETAKQYRADNSEKIKEIDKNYRETKKQNNLIYKWLLMTGIIV